jgi:beta-lactamase regulating signal transducer with metallopeptidase domain
MDTPETTYSETISSQLASYKKRSRLSLFVSSVAAALIALGVFYCSLLATSQPITAEQYSKVNDAIELLESKGFTREAFLLRHTAEYRRSDNWFNASVMKADSYAATNFPFQIVTLYPDFYSKTTDNVERAMVLLHEAKHLESKDENAAYAYVWQNRERLGWTQLSHGTTPTYITISEQTRENAPELFTCTDRLWSDCTETIK